MDMDDDDDDATIRQKLKVVEVLECVPGNARTTDGPPITILTLAYKGEVQQALLVSLRDTKKLVTDLLVALAHHGDAFAKDLLDEHFPADDYPKDQTVEESETLGI